MEGNTAASVSRVCSESGSWMKAAGTEESRPTDMENRLMQTGPLLHHRGQRVEHQG
ncbi:hypothetical protein FQA47_000399 [Oryzias melastigma]|uniref:Uncharacterized protein n=1 Tax=Oryzias melastigma TaxID=30732 RepID=A0A834CBF6_ORYME|nr:hypothetical protein FQA47_000399 [Oryzias melastigma]